MPTYRHNDDGTLTIESDSDLQSKQQPSSRPPRPTDKQSGYGLGNNDFPPVRAWSLVLIVLLGIAAVVLVVVLLNVFSGQRGSGSLPVTEAMKVSEPESEPEPESELNQLQGLYPPSFTRAEASSEQSADGYASSSYSPQNVLDKDGATAWLEGVDGPGVGQWIQLSAVGLQQVSGIKILSGFPKSVEIYYANYRPQGITIELSDGYRQRIYLDDTCGTSQSFWFDGTHDAQWIRLTIDSYYDTNHWTDNAIAEIELF